jgi:hypothetical protein
MCSGSNPALSPARPKVTVPLHYGDTTSVLSYRSQEAIDLGAGEAGSPDTSLTGCLVDPINDARSEVERCQVPILEINLGIG